jgi:hypothetical protein
MHAATTPARRRRGNPRFVADAHCRMFALACLAWCQAKKPGKKHQFTVRARQLIAKFYKKYI